MEEKARKFREMLAGETTEQCHRRLLVEDLRDVADGIESGKDQISHSNVQNLAAKLIQIQEQLPTIVSDRTVLEDMEEDFEK